MRSKNFSVGQVSTLSNVLTLSHDVRKAFDRFGIWLEEVPGQVRFTFCPKFFLSPNRAIQSQENIYIVEMAENERRVLRAHFHPVLPLVSLSKLTQIVRRFVRRMALRYPSCLVGI
jgi:hypothetical protein